MEQQPTVGRVVHFVLGGGEVRPAFIVKVWGDTCVNLRVFFDGSNDEETAQYPEGWVTSVLYDASETPTPRTWHWPPRG